MSRDWFSSSLASFSSALTVLYVAESDLKKKEQHGKAAYA
jgi:hypothetical protein